MTTGSDSPTATIRAAAGYLQQWLETQAAHRRVPGVQVAVRSEGELVLSTAVGVADTTPGTPLTTEHLFHVASHSKTFTATAVLQLVDADRMRLDDPIGRYVPELAGTPVARATVRELLGHQSGVTRDGAAADFWQLEGPFPGRGELLAAVLQGGAVHARNEHFKYSNVGYALVGLAIEEVTGRPFAEHVRSALLEPLELSRTGADHDPDRAGEYAAGHTALLLGEHERLVLGHAPTGAYAPATGFWSTAEELSSFAAAALLPGDERLISDDARRIMQRLESVVIPYGTEAGRYGVGVALSTVGDRQLVGHSGGWPGHITLTLADPATGLVVSVLTNAIDGPAEDLAHGVVKLIDAALTPRAEVPPPPEGSPVASFAGRFAGLWGVLDVVDLGGRLVLVRPTAPDPLHGMEELQVVDGDTLRLAPQPGFGPAGELVPVERDDAGAVAALRLGGVTHRPLAEFLRRRDARGS
ncbi:serine hydrolase domain-containing protein [Blastococcus sp. CCUG 61487]|uniref:serine hydrolase domain-containing protein n=1 Tax=Blastococcus sp. CCUG 61487 TaxID=1840703 RepID=UPI0010C02650|nr:serine hydrolase domain-containing protein [Blastococcus sp. CCUG 61487]TKJ22384.1 serine hydrolase [Blastococcus sp. CCUG 61487]